MTLLLVAGFFWLRAHDAKVKAQAVAEQRNHEAQVFLDSVQVLEQEIAAKRDTLEQVEAWWRAERVKADYQLAEARKGVIASRRSLDSLLALPPSTPELRVLGVVNAEREACTLALTACDSTNEALAGQLVTYSREVLAKDSALVVIQGRWEDAERRASPSWFTRVSRDWPVLLVAFVVGLVVGK